MNLGQFWRRDEALEYSLNLPPRGIVAAYIVLYLAAAVEQLHDIEADQRNGTG